METTAHPIYLDCNATTPIEPSVRQVMLAYFDEEIGNAGSRTHVYGTRSRRAVEEARDQIAKVVDAQPEEVTFTSGATESNNLAILGLADFGLEQGRRHIVSTQIEHKAVLGPLKEMERRGFEVTLLAPTTGGYVEPGAVQAALRGDTLLVSVMHVNNETGVEQPLGKIAALLGDHAAFFHVDAAQGFGKSISALRLPRIDLMSLSSHKVYGPKGIGALVARRRRFRKPPLQPLLHGGDQERGLRSGTLPVPLIAGFGEAARLALADHADRRRRCDAFRRQALRHLLPLSPRLNGDQERTLPHTLSFAIPGVDAEAAMVALKDLVAVSNGSACTSARYEPSHVLLAMGLSDEEANQTIRMSWCHATPEPDWKEIVRRLGEVA
jgi:cysteine desulfurase